MREPILEETMTPPSAPTNIPTRFALTKRAEKLLRQIDEYFQDADDFGLTVEQADPKGEMVKIRKALIAILEREHRLKKEGKI